MFRKTFGIVSLTAILISQAGCSYFSNSATSGPPHLPLDTPIVISDGTVGVTNVGPTCAYDQWTADDAAHPRRLDHIVSTLQETAIRMEYAAKVVSGHPTAWHDDDSCAKNPEDCKQYRCQKRDDAPCEIKVHFGHAAKHITVTFHSTNVWPVLSGDSYDFDLADHNQTVLMKPKLNEKIEKITINHPNVTFDCSAHPCQVSIGIK